MKTILKQMLVSKMSFYEAFFIEIIGGDLRDQMLDLKIAQFSPKVAQKVNTAVFTQEDVSPKSNQIFGLLYLEKNRPIWSHWW